MIIRKAEEKDYPNIYQLVEEAFKTARVSDGTEQDFVCRLRKGAGFIPELELVAEEDGTLVGHVMLTRQAIQTRKGDYGALLLAPLCVALPFRNQGLGQRLMAEAFSRARELGQEAVLLVGNPAYYGRAGFRPAADFGIENTSGFPAEFLLAKELIPDALADRSGTVSLES